MLKLRDDTLEERKTSKVKEANWMDMMCDRISRRVEERLLQSMSEMIRDLLRGDIGKVGVRKRDDDVASLGGGGRFTRTAPTPAPPGTGSSIAAVAGAGAPSLDAAALATLGSDLMSQAAAGAVDNLSSSGSSASAASNDYDIGLKPAQRHRADRGDSVKKKKKKGGASASKAKAEKISPSAMAAAEKTIAAAAAANLSAKTLDVPETTAGEPPPQTPTKEAAPTELAQVRAKLSQMCQVILFNIFMFKEYVNVFYFILNIYLISVQFLIRFMYVLLPYISFSFKLYYIYMLLS